MKIVLFHSFGLMLMKKIKVKMFGFSEKSGSHRQTHLFHAHLKFWECKDMFIFIQASLQNKAITFKELWFQKYSAWKISTLDLLMICSSKKLKGSIVWRCRFLMENKNFLSSSIQLSILLYLKIWKEKLLIQFLVQIRACLNFSCLKKNLKDLAGLLWKILQLLEIKDNLGVNMS